MPPIDEDIEIIDPTADFGPDELTILLESELCGVYFHATEEKDGSVRAIAALPRYPKAAGALEAEYRYPGMYRLAIKVNEEMVDVRGATVTESVEGLLELLKTRRDTYNQVIHRLELAFVQAVMDGTSVDE